MIAKLKSLKNHQGFMKYFKNTSWLFAEKILRMVVGLFVGIWVARYLGPEQFGLFSYAQSFVGLFTAIATLGLDGIVVRELVKNQQKENMILGTVFYLKLVGAIVTLVILYIAIYFTSNNHYTNIMIFIIASAIIFQSFNVVDMYFQSKVMSKYVVYANILSLFISSLVKIALILTDAPLIDFAWAVLFDSFILACGFIYFFLRNSKFDIKYIEFKRETAVSLLKNSWPLILSGIVVSIYMKIDQVMIKAMMDNNAVGQYAAAVRISTAWYFVSSIISKSLFPAIQNAKKNSHKNYNQRVINLLNFLYFLSIPIVVIVYIYSDEIILLLYGKAYLQSVTVLSIHIFTSVFVFLGVGMHYWILAENLQKYEFYSLSFGAFINIIMNYIFIQYWGIVGAAIATLVSQIIANIFLLYLIKETRFIAIQQLKTIVFLNIKYIREH
jgi:O-antigen/teichoic acid export membrane protein